MNASLFLSIVFWGSVVVVFYTFAGYAIVIGFLARLKRKPNRAPGLSAQTASVVLIAYNEAQRIRARIENLFATDHPAEKLELIVYSDGSTDETAAILQSFPDKR